MPGHNFIFPPPALRRRGSILAGYDVTDALQEIQRRLPPVEAAGASIIGRYLACIERGEIEIIDRATTHSRQGDVAVEQGDAAALFQQQAVEHIVQALELEGTQQVGRQRQPRLSDVWPHIVDTADEIDRRETPAQVGEVRRFDLAHDLKLGACARKGWRSYRKERFDGGSLGWPVEAADQNGPPRHGRIALS